MFYSGVRVNETCKSGEIIFICFWDCLLDYLTEINSIVELVNVFVSGLIKNVFSSNKLLYIMLAIRNGIVKLCNV